MTRLFCVAIVVAAVSLTAPSAWASVPDPGYSTVTWQLLADDTTAMICPACDASYLDVVVKDQFGIAMGGVPVEATFDGAVIYLKTPSTGNTDGSGYVKLDVCGGTDGSGGEQTVTSFTKVTCMGVTIYENDKDFLSPDMSQGVGSENVVEGLDYTIFAGDWLSFLPGSRSNFNRLCNEALGECVGGLDYAIFAQHWLH